MSRIPENCVPACPNADERNAIIAAIRAETDAFLDGDFEAWSACWIQDARTQDVYSSAVAGLSVLDGWPAVAGHMQHVMAAGLTCRKTHIRQENHRISIDGDTAWVVFDGHSEGESGDIDQNFETRILERGSDGWKIVYSSVLEKRHSDRHNREIAVSKDGRVIWSGPESLNALKTHPFLTISSGKVRAHRRDWDKALQGALVKAGNYHGFFELYRFSTDTGGPFQYPVILGDADDGSVAVVHISVRDCMTYLRLDGDGLFEHRLAVARAAFGLSDGQMRIASRIATGESLKEAADRLSISINTARTHLSRLYEKTGVNSQTALVRLLLSVG